MRFFVGLHQPSDAKNFESAFISIHRIKDRKSDFKVNDWIMDSGAFSTILKYGGYPDPVEEYAKHIKRWSKCGNLLAAVSQDYMCEKNMLEITGKTIQEHQHLTIERYKKLLNYDVGGIKIIPVLQGYKPEDYVSHIEQYGELLKKDMWVGVGSVCKRNGNVGAIQKVLWAIKEKRPDLKLHGFGLKTTALSDGLIRSLLETADSMAWSYSARAAKRNANDWREAKIWEQNIVNQNFQQILFI